ncbi:MAG TPA: glutamyl-tRNA reductase [Sedimentisphaerales bacterium]|nr:glutamyl-tRNA reductase [Sedimentisphaerales bacterium]
MNIIVVGLNHKTAPLDIREKLAFDAADTMKALRQLKGRFRKAEFVLLSTCNRVELYCACQPAGAVNAETIAEFFSEFRNVALPDFQDFVYVYKDEDAVSHLLTVASSLDSMVVGEAQIIGQVKESYRFACTAKSTGKILNRLFHCAFAVSKKVHTITSIATGRVSVAGVAVELAMQLFADISTTRVVVIGAGEMGELLVRHLLHAECQNITVVNRSYERGLSVANRYGIEAKEWEALPEELNKANIVIASAATQDYLFRKSSFKEIMESRRQRTLLLIDIAVPRNFEPDINEIENVYLYSIDELSEVAEQNRKAREEDIAKGMQIIYENVTEFIDWFRARDIGPLIGQMKEKFDQISRDELERFFVGARQDASCREMMETMMKRVVNKLLHCVIKNVDVVAKKHGPAEAAKLVDSIVRQAEEISAEPNNKDNVQS